MSAHHSRTSRSLRRLVPLGAVAAMAFGLLTPAVESAAAAACTLYWTGATSTNWTTTTNWSTNANGQTAGRVPLTTDFVCLASSPTRFDVTYASLSRKVAGLNFAAVGTARPSLTIDGGFLVVGTPGNAFDSTINNLQIRSGGTVGGSADLLLTGTPSLTNGAILDGAGTTTLAPGTNVSTNGLVLSNGRRLIVQGVLSHTECYDYIYLYGGAVLQNSGRINASSSCGHRIASDGSPGSRLVNDVAAEIVINQPAADAYDLGVQLENHGNVSVSAGTLMVHPVSTTDGTYTVGSGSQLLIGPDGTLRVGADTMRGAGLLVLAGGILNGAPGSSLAALEMRSGSITGTPSIRSLTGGGTATLDAGGTLTIPPGGTATLETFTASNGSRLINRGTLTHIGKDTTFNLRSGAVLENAAVFRVQTSGSGSMTSDGSAGTSFVNDNGATFTLNQASTTSKYQIDPVVNNQGTIEQTRGRVNIKTFANLVTGRLTGGTLIATGGTIQIPANITTNAGIVVIGLVGKLVNPSDGNPLARLASNTGTLTLGKGLDFEVPLVNSGTLTVSMHQMEAPSYRQTAGTTNLLGDGALVSTNGPESISFDGGTLAGDGRIYSFGGAGTVRPVGELIISGGYLPVAGSSLAIGIQASGPANRLLVNGASSYTGTLAITTAAGFTPAVGTTYTIVSSVRWDGAFTRVTGQTLPNGRHYEVSYTNGAVKLIVRAP
ncbi:MAG: hypothetical protein ACR2J5_09695 [Geodermatophilaceae bacterium]